MRILVLGLGNPILSDDSVGLKVAQALKGRFDEQNVTVVESSASGLDLLDLMLGYEKLVVIDAIKTEGGKVGHIHRLVPEDFDAASPHWPHAIDLLTALNLGKKLGLPLPHQIVIFAVEVADVKTFGEECTPEVERAIPKALEMVVSEIGESPLQDITVRTGSRQRSPEG
jgi:hydrogenase maturation protease